MHSEAHPWAYATVSIAEGVEDPFQNAVTAGAFLDIEDWWDRVHGSSWQTSSDSKSLQYALRAGWNRIPMDDQVAYGLIDGVGYLVHMSEIRGAEALVRAVPKPKVKQSPEDLESTLTRPAVWAMPSPAAYFTARAA